MFILCVHDFVFIGTFFYCAMHQSRHHSSIILYDQHIDFTEHVASSNVKMKIEQYIKKWNEENISLESMLQDVVELKRDVDLIAEKVEKIPGKFV